MNILLTGGTGLIGSQFIHSYPQYQYTVLTRDVSAAGKKLPATVKLLSSLDELEDLNNFDSVINLAGEPLIGKRWTGSDGELVRTSRLHTTAKLVELFHNSAHPPEVFLSGSAIGIYGDTGSLSYDESAELNATDFPATLCKDWELSAEQAASKTRVVSLRTGIVLATQGGALAQMLPTFKLGLGGPIGNGEQYMSWIHIQDFLRAVDFLLHNKITGAVNMVAPSPLTNREFTSTLAKVLRRPAFFRVPPFILKIMLKDSSELLLGSQRISPFKLSESSFEFLYPALEDALRNLLGKDSEF